MKKILTATALIVLFCFVATSGVMAGAKKVTPSAPAKATPKAAAKPNIMPWDVVVGINDNDCFAKYKGLKVRVNNKPDDFFACNFFVTLNDLKDLAKKRNVKCSYDAKTKKLTLGTKTFEQVAVNPKGKDEILLDKVKVLNYNKQVYFDLWDVYGGLGFSSVSKLTNGLSMYDPKLDKKKK